MSVFQKVLHTKEQLLEQKDAKLHQMEKDMEELLHVHDSHLRALDEQEERARVQVRRGDVVDFPVGDMGL